MNEGYTTRVEQASRAIKNTQKLVIGAGAGLSSAAGIEYDGKRFEENFKPFIEKYGMKDLYTSSFYPFRTQEEKWAYWAKHNRDHMDGMSENLGSTISFDEDMTTVINNIRNY